MNFEVKNLIFGFALVFGLSFGFQAEACDSCDKHNKECAEECEKKGHSCDHKKGEDHAHHEKGHEGHHAKGEKSCDKSKDCRHCEKNKEAKEAEKAKKPAA